MYLLILKTASYNQPSSTILQIHFSREKLFLYRLFSSQEQFGAVYLIDENFPCPVIDAISSAVSFERGNPSVYSEVGGGVCQVLRQLSRIAMNLAGKIPTANLNNKCKLLPERVFFKPIVVNCIEEASYAVTHLLTAFQLLYSNEPCRKYIVFRSFGSMGMLDDTQLEMKNTLSSVYAGRQV